MRTIARKRQKKQRLSFIYILIGIVALSIVLYLILQVRADKEVGVTWTGRDSPSILETLTGGYTKKDMPLHTAKDKDIKLPTIKSITFTPAEPTVLDSIKAGVTADHDREGLTYEYSWEINNRAITDIKGDTLPAGLFKKGDAIRVMVTPLADGMRGHTHESRFIVIHSAPPSLELKEVSQRLTEMIEFQLVSIDPDGDKVTFSLEDPILEGMTINRETGRITWRVGKKDKGAYKFRASAEDIDGARTTKTFEFSIHDK